MGSFGGMQVKTNIAKFSAECHSVDCRGERKNRERGEGEGRRNPLSLFSHLEPPAPLPRVTFLSTTARPAPPRRVLSNMAATKSEHRVFSSKKTPTPTGRLLPIVLPLHAR